MSVMAVESLAAALFDIPTGIFSDRMGRRLTMSSGSLCMALALICYASANGITALYIGAVLIGLGQCFFSGNNNALLYESLRSEDLESEYHHYRSGAGSMSQLALCTSAFFAIWLSRFGLSTGHLYKSMVAKQFQWVAHREPEFIEVPDHIRSGNCAAGCGCICQPVVSGTARSHAHAPKRNL